MSGPHNIFLCFGDHQDVSFYQCTLHPWQPGGYSVWLETIGEEVCKDITAVVWTTSSEMIGPSTNSCLTSSEIKTTEPHLILRQSLLDSDTWEKTAAAVQKF